MISRLRSDGHGASTENGREIISIFMKEDVMDDEIKNWIDNASYEQLLSKWRMASAGSPFFQGETGDYYSKVMAEKRKSVGNAEHVRASKSIGW
jgi:hypothetical protein